MIEVIRRIILRAAERQQKHAAEMNKQKRRCEQNSGFQTSPFAESAGGIEPNQRKQREQKQQQRGQTFANAERRLGAETVECGCAHAEL